MEDKPDNSTEAKIKSEMKVAAKLKKQRPSTFTPRSPSVASEAQNIFQGAQKGMQSAFQAAQYGDESLAFFAGAGGAFGGPSAQEIENQFVKHEMAAEQQALMQANIMDVAPDQVAQASEALGADLSTLNVGQFSAMQPVINDAIQFKKQRAMELSNQPANDKNLAAIGALKGWDDDTVKSAITAFKGRPLNKVVTMISNLKTRAEVKPLKSGDIAIAARLLQVPEETIRNADPQFVADAMRRFSRVQSVSGKKSGKQERPGARALNEALGTPSSNVTAPGKSSEKNLMNKFGLK